MTHRFRIASSMLALGIAGATAPAFAQSTGSIDLENDQEIVVTGSRGPADVGGVQVPDSVKARGVITQELVARQNPGQSILNTINLLPGVNFTQSDAYGSSGGNLRIRGFDGNRISLTFDGFPLNDSGNYAIFSNQQLDPELIEQVNVNLGTTDVDSPTASAAGGTVNYRTITPSETLSAKLVGSYGDFDFHRIFGLLETGNLTSFGTRAFVSASNSTNRKFKGPGKIDKEQYNFRVYQPIGDNGDFVSLAGHYNQNRNNFYRNPSVSDLRGLFGSTVIPAAGSFSPDNPLDLGSLTKAQEEALFGFENLASCNRPTPGPGRQDENGGTGPNGTGAAAPSVNGSANNNPLNASSCTNYYKLRINPSNTGNLRFNSRFSLTEQLLFTLDASYQYVLANGGGFTALNENDAIVKGSQTTGPGVDYNGDGDTADRIAFYTPNNTNTNRYTAIASLIYDITPEQRVRIAYTYDDARHRQTGEWGYLQLDGGPDSPFGGRQRPVLNADGFQLQQRDRYSIARLNQISGQYVGRFFDDALRIELGLRAPFFERELNQFCYTQTGGSGFATCTSQPASQLTIVAPDFAGVYPANSFFAPFTAKYKFDKLLPSAGLNYRLVEDLHLFASYAKGFSAPRTDNLYRQPIVNVTPESTDAFDLGLKYGSRRIQAQLTGWYIQFKNRIVTSFDQTAGISVDRNVGKVDAYGFDGNIAFKVADPLTLYAFGSYNHSELKQDVQIGTFNAGTTAVPNIVPVFAPTAGKRVTETPEWTVGGRAELSVGPIDLGAQVKWNDKRFATDVNDVVVPSYTLVDLDARFNLAPFGLERTYFQLNVQNVFDEFYYGNISTQINASNICPAGSPNCGLSNSANPNFSIGSPRTFSGSVIFAF